MGLHHPALMQSDRRDSSDYTHGAAKPSRRRTRCAFVALRPEAFFIEMEMSLHGPRVFSLLFEVCNLIRGIPAEEVVCKQYGFVNFWYSLTMAFRASLEDSRHKLQGPARDKEYRLVVISFNIEQSRILDGDVLHAQYGLQTGRRRARRGYRSMLFAGPCQREIQA